MLCVPRGGASAKGTGFVVTWHCWSRLFDVADQEPMLCRWSQCSCAIHQDIFVVVGHVVEVVEAVGGVIESVEDVVEAVKGVVEAVEDVVEVVGGVVEAVVGVV
jgi:hypothetical protein